eukprot:248297-Prymnesium_polylepis.1
MMPDGSGHLFSLHSCGLPPSTVPHTPAMMDASDTVTAVPACARRLLASCLLDGTLCATAHASLT